jgi:phosphonate transport system permease protein
VVVATLASALLAAILFAGIAWLYETENVLRFVGVPAVVAGAIMLVIGLIFDVERPVPTGMIIYNIMRTILNVLRAIEPLIMVVAFAVWVGIGPFAGVIALALHTIAGLGKLYSEQVENILVGPIEAVTATGANRLQTIVYAVIPQIVPPYLAFTIYRWDINVRMSTIIGFGGGGGIGFLVQQNLNLLKYRDASVQMIAIAIVVSTLDYMSARVRERII